MIRNLILGTLALIFGGGGLFLWLRLGNDAAPPALLGGTLALTCLLFMMSRRR